MTKFEEELFNKVPCKFELTTEAEYKKSTLINHFKNWHSEEEFQELLGKYSNLNDNYEKEVIRSSKLETSNLKLIAEGTGLLSDNAMLTKKVEDLKSKLQQQALPVVPECVSELFNEYRFENIQRLFEFGIDDIKSNKMIKALMWRDKHPDTFSLAFITGKYEVEKPQLFYLKNKLTGMYLNIRLDDGTYEKSDNKYHHMYRMKFTKQEIDSMETGSYEQIKVEEEK